MTRREPCDRRAALGGCFLTGFAAGRAVHLLIAPYPGHVSRDKIRGAFETGQAKVRETIGNLADQARTVAATAAERVGNAADRVKRNLQRDVRNINVNIEAGREAYQIEVNA
jgi:gas vesicle protein